MNETENIDNNQEQNKHQLFVPTRTEKDEGTLTYEGNPVREKTMAVLGAIAATGLVLMSVVVDWDRTEPQVANVTPMILESIPKPPSTPNPYYALSLEAKSAIVYDVHNDMVLFGINQKKAQPLASLTKMMTALVAMETFDEQSNIAIPFSALATEGDSGLYANETWKVKDLVAFTMLTSSNDGAGALAASAGAVWESSTPSTLKENHDRVDTFVDRMNLRAEEIGLQSTAYTNPTGLDTYGTGGLGSAEDMSKLLTYIWEHEPGAINQTVVKEKSFISEDNLPHHASNTNEYVDRIPGLIGSKTGYTDMAGGNLAVIYDSGMDHPIVIVVLGSTLEGRFVDVETLVEATYDYIESGWFEYEKMSDSTSQNV